MSSACHWHFLRACNLSSIVKVILNQLQIQFKNQYNGTVTDELLYFDDFRDILSRYSSASGCIFIHETVKLNEPRCEKTGLRGFRPGPTQTGLYSHIRWLEA